MGSFPGSRWMGEFADGETAALRAVSVRFDGQFLLIQADDGADLARWDVAQVMQESGGARSAVHLVSRAAPDALLILHGEGIGPELDAIGVGGRAPRLGGRRAPFIAVALMLGIAGAVGLVWIAVTPVSRALAEQIPLEFERALGGRVEQSLAKLHCESDAAAVVLETLVDRVGGTTDSIPPIHVLNVGMPNAFALPGGSIVLTRGLLQAAEHPDEVAGILAHEIQHVRQRHVMTGMIRGTLLTTLWAVTVGDYSGLFVVDPSTAFQIATLQFSRADEESADRGALEMLDAAGIRRDGLSDFFERLAEEEGEPSEWLSTHPPSATRARASRAAPALDRTMLSPALDEAQWEILVAACDHSGRPESKIEDLVF